VSRVRFDAPGYEAADVIQSRFDDDRYTRDAVLGAFYALFRPRADGDRTFAFDVEASSRHVAVEVWETTAMKEAA